MATDDKQRILDWCSTDSHVRCVGEESDPGADFTLVLDSAGAELTAGVPTGADRLVVRSIVDLGEAVRPAGGDLAADLADLEEHRPGSVTIGQGGADDQVKVATWVVLDGLTKHSFLTAVSEVIRTRRAVLRLAGLPADAPAAAATDLASMAAASPAAGNASAQGGAAASGAPADLTPAAAAGSAAAPAPVPAPWEWPPVSAQPAVPAGEPVPAAQPDEPASDAFAFRTEERAGAPSSWASPEATVFEPGPTPAQGVASGGTAPGYGATPGGAGQDYGRVFTPAPEPAPAPAAGQQPWTPSHRVPPQGMQAWAAPDPAGAVIATLGGHLPVQVTEVRGAWAHIVCSNGWTGWVDDRLLVVGA
jgi:hypothetical protein